MEYLASTINPKVSIHKAWSIYYVRIIMLVALHGICMEYTIILGSLSEVGKCKDDLAFPRPAFFIVKNSYITYEILYSSLDKKRLQNHYLFMKKC